MAGPPQTSRGHLRWHCPPFHWSLRPSTLLVPFSLRSSPENTRTLSRLLAPTMFLLLIPLRKKPPVESSMVSQGPACPRGGPGEGCHPGAPPLSSPPHHRAQDANPSHPPTELLGHCCLSFCVLVILPSVSYPNEPTNKL